MVFGFRSKLPQKSLQISQKAIHILDLHFSNSLNNLHRKNIVTKFSFKLVGNLDTNWNDGYNEGALQCQMWKAVCVGKCVQRELVIQKKRTSKVRYNV